VAEEAIAAATDGLGDGRETSRRGNIHIPDELEPAMEPGVCDGPRRLLTDNSKLLPTTIRC